MSLSRPWEVEVAPGVWRRAETTSELIAFADAAGRVGEPFRLRPAVLVFGEKK